MSSMKSIRLLNCEKKKLLQCSGHAITKLVNDKHYLQSWTDYNHAADVSWSHVAITIAKIKEKAQQTNDRLSRIAQDAITDSTHFKIWHFDLLTELPSLESLVIPQNMKTTLN
ncbi:9278_t:CDS:2, partial [Dentiscutata heterogama]